MQPLKLGVIGAGLIWRRVHGPILEKLNDAFTPVAFCELSAERREALTQEFPAARIVADSAELLALPEVEAVLVLTPLPLNAPTARAAIRAGKHVIMEKPIARSVAEGRELIAEARRAGLLLCVTEQAAYRRAGELLAELIAAGEIGDLVMWNQVMHMEGDTARGDLRFETTPWRKQADFPLGTMFDGGVHTIAGLSRVFGVPSAAAASGVQLRPEYGAYDQISALFHYTNGTSGLLSHSSYLHPGGNHFHIYGTAGVITVQRERIVVARPGEAERTIETPAENSYVSMWHAIRLALSEGRDPPYAPEDALNDVATLEAVAHAIESEGRAQVDVTLSPAA